MFKRVETFFLFLLVVQFSKQDLDIPFSIKLGVATAAYQIEGAWNESGKGENIWDRLTHSRPDLIADHLTGDIACDSYHKVPEDVQNLADLGVNHYRFSISWSRLLPNGFSNYVNPEAVSYYNLLINFLLVSHIEPMITLYHWDLPQVIQEIGGWMNPRIIDYFEDYARVAFELFGDRVKYWITVNEPPNICIAPYEVDGGAPTGVQVPGIGLYLCGKNLILAHARVYRLYENNFRDEQKGRVGITLDSLWAEPKTNNTEDVRAASRAMQMGPGWWAHPIFSAKGDYPEIMITRIFNNSFLENFHESRLPPFSEEERNFVQGTFDFFGLNHYNTLLISENLYQPTDPPSYEKDKEAAAEPVPEGAFAPWGLRKLLNWIKDEYNNPPVIITENGLPDSGGTQDDDRIRYIKEFLRAVILAVTEDGCNVEGYTVWSLMDDLEWRAGYTVKFGLYEVDFSDPNRTRTPKASARFYKQLTSTRVLPED